MSIDDIDNPSARRLRIRRRAGGGFSRGSMSESNSLRMTDSQDDYDEVDGAIDPEDVDNSARELARRPPSNNPQGDPGRRLAEVTRSGSQQYSREYRMTLLHRLLLRNIPLDQIAKQLNVSISTVEKDRATLKKHLREVARNLDIEQIIGNQTGLYQEVSGMALRVASDAGQIDQRTGQVVGGQPVPMRLAAMRTVLAAQADLTRFYNSAGVFDAMRFRKADDGGGVSDVQMLMDETRQLLASMAGGGDDFPVFSMNDGGDPESEEL